MSNYSPTVHIPETATPLAQEDLKANMNETPMQQIEEAIKLELYMAELYTSFHNRYPEDANFWWELALEEKSHASSIVNCKQRLLDSDLFPSESAGESLEALVNINSAMEGILRREMEHPPLERILAFKLAVKLEESAGEIHFQHVIQKTGHTSEALKLLQNLSKDDKDHADRIRNYMSRNGMA